MNAFMTSTADPQRDRQYREVQRGDVVRPRAPHPGQSGHGQDGRATDVPDYLFTDLARCPRQR